MEISYNLEAYFQEGGRAGDSCHPAPSSLPGSVAGTDTVPAQTSGREGRRAGPGGELALS